MTRHDPTPGPLAKAMIAVCLVLVVFIVGRSLLGMAETIDRVVRQPFATDCEMFSDLCEE